MPSPIRLNDAQISHICEEIKRLGDPSQCPEECVAADAEALKDFILMLREYGFICPAESSAFRNEVDEVIGRRKGRCVFCGERYRGIGNDAAPLAPGRRCCDTCYMFTVVPKRLKTRTINL